MHPLEAQDGRACQVVRPVAAPVDALPGHGFPAALGPGGLGADMRSLAAVGGVAAQLHREPALAAVQPEGRPLDGRLPAHLLVGLEAIARPSAIDEPTDPLDVRRIVRGRDRRPRPDEASLSGHLAADRDSGGGEEGGLGIGAIAGDVATHGLRGPLEDGLQERPVGLAEGRTGGPRRGSRWRRAGRRGPSPRATTRPAAGAADQGGRAGAPARRPGRPGPGG